LRSTRSVRQFGLAVALTATGAAACVGPSPAPNDTTIPVPPPEVSASPPATSAGSTDAVPPRDDLPSFFGNGLTILQHGSFGFDRAHVLPATDPAVGPTLRVNYPAGSASNLSANTDGSAYGGTQVYLQPTNGPVDQLHLRYYLRFQPGFDFVKGGKLPGLYGGTVTSGRHIPDGSNGFSTRYMWRRSGAGEVYAYLPSSVEHGTSLGRGSWSFTPGQWICIEQAVQLNTPGRADGSVSVWLDGKLVFNQPDLSYRTTDKLKIDGLFFSTFFGGGDSSWASPADQYTDFAAFAISEQYIGPLSHPPN
jgi:hypothetical protein